MNEAPHSVDAADVRDDAADEEAEETKGAASEKMAWLQSVQTSEAGTFANADSSPLAESKPDKSETVNCVPVAVW